MLGTAHRNDPAVPYRRGAQIFYHSVTVNLKFLSCGEGCAVE
jgi:hypothetical protein